MINERKKNNMTNWLFIIHKVRINFLSNGKKKQRNVNEKPDDNLCIFFPIHEETHFHIRSEKYFLKKQKRKIDSNVYIVKLLE